MKEDQVAERLSAWGDCQVLGRLPGGYRNKVLLVERKGERLVAKSSCRGSEAIGWLEPIQEMAREVGFVVPRFVRSMAGELLVGGVTVETWVEGRSPSEAELARAQDLVQGFHRITRGWHQRPGFASCTDLLEVKRGGDVDLSLMPRELVEACRKAWRGLLNEQLSVVHGDLNPANFLVTPEGQLALIDWDETRVDVSCLDETALVSMLDGEAEPRSARAGVLGLLAWEVAASWQVEPEHARRLARQLLSGQVEWRS